MFRAAAVVDEHRAWQEPLRAAPPAVAQERLREEQPSRARSPLTRSSIRVAARLVSETPPALNAMETSSTSCW
jgi:hypothetical protein